MHIQFNIIIIIVSTIKNTMKEILRILLSCLIVISYLVHELWSFTRSFFVVCESKTVSTRRLLTTPFTRTSKSVVCSAVRGSGGFSGKSKTMLLLSFRATNTPLIVLNSNLLFLFPVNKKIYINKILHAPYQWKMYLIKAIWKINQLTMHYHVKKILVKLESYLKVIKSFIS